VAEIRELTEEHYPELTRIAGDAYPRMGMLTPDERTKQLERFKISRRDTRWVPYGLFRDGRMVGVFRRFDFVLNIRNVLVPAGGLGMVAVDLEHKKERVAKEMVRFFHDYYCQRDTTMTTLWPFRIDFYHDMGYGLGGAVHEYRFSPTDLPRGASKKHVRLLTKDDIPAINECQDRMFRKRIGMLDSCEAYLENKMQFAPELRYFGCELDGRLEAYMICRWRKPEQPTSFMDNDLAVWEIVYHTAEALAELFAFLHSQLDQVGRLWMQVADDEFYFLPRNPTMRTERQLPPNFHDGFTGAVGTMYRVLNARQLWTQLADCDFNGTTLTVRINLHDSFLRANDGHLIVRFESGHPRVVDQGTPDVEIALDVAEFSSLLMGAVHFRTLCDYRLAAISEVSKLDEIDRLFSYPQRPVCYTGF